MTRPPRSTADPGAANGAVAGLIHRTRWARAYSSRHTQSLLTPSELELLSHVNCSYLSTPGAPPTLLGLKRHAQSLAILIQKLTLSTTTGDIDNRLNSEPAPDLDGKPRSSRGECRAFRENEAFDWLNDLDHPYDNHDEWHHAPLMSLVNGVESETEHHGVRFHCPMSQFAPVRPGCHRPPDASPLTPFGTHWHLAEHANQCLAVLDHEFSPEGGILAMIPPDTPSDDQGLRSLRKTILGQWILFTQHLVARAHDLEISYANALDALAGEAVVPMQLVAGRDGPAAAAREGRDVAFPQDRWILANAGDAVSKHVHQLLDAEEKAMMPREKEWRDAGAVSQRLVGAAGNAGAHALEEGLFERGLVMVDVKTRYMRLREHGHDAPIFVLPAHGSQPGVSRTLQMEALPTVVTVAAPSYPPTTSAWLKEHGQRLERAQEIEAQNAHLVQQHDELAEQMRRLNLQVRFYEAHVDDDMAAQIERLHIAMHAASKETRVTKQELKDLEDMTERVFGNKGWRAERAERKRKKGGD